MEWNSSAVLSWEYSGEGNASLALAVSRGGAGGAVLGAYGALLAAGALGNAAVLRALRRARRPRRLHLLMTHLALADTCVTCGVIPLEIGWTFTNAWLAGNAGCKLLLVLRAFGLYLSSNVLVCISVDRLFAVLYPLRQAVARRRSKQMLCGAWAAALACSLPQSVVFSVQQHPLVAGFEQCVSFGAFGSPRRELLYNAFCLCAVYFAPLAVISACYLAIFCKIRRSSRDVNGGGRCSRPRRADGRVLRRARRRTLRMTLTIVGVFALCWLPYATMALWYMVDRSSAQRVSRRAQGLLFACAVSNSCANPLVYGSYCLDLRGALVRLARRARRACPPAPPASAAPRAAGNSGSSSIKKNLNVEAPLATKNGRARTRLGVRFAETTLVASAGAAGVAGGAACVAAARAPA